jgi:hypothetical protein
VSTLPEASPTYRSAAALEFVIMGRLMTSDLRAGPLLPSSCFEVHRFAFHHPRFADDFADGLQMILMSIPAWWWTCTISAKSAGEVDGSSVGVSGQADHLLAEVASAGGLDLLSICAARVHARSSCNNCTLETSYDWLNGSLPNSALHTVVSASDTDSGVPQLTGLG